MRTPSARHVGLKAVALTAALGLAAWGCGNSPTAPGTKVQITAVSSLITSAATQTVTVSGRGFQKSTSLIIKATDGSAAKANVTQIVNVKSSSFQATVAITAGAYSFTATNTDGASSTAFAVVVPLPCASPAPLLGTFDPLAPKYIAQYVSGTNPDTMTPTLAARYGFSPSSVFHIFPGFSAQLTPITVDNLRCEASVLNLEFDGVVSFAGTVRGGGGN